jgi:hypothetical protein
MNVLDLYVVPFYALCSISLIFMSFLSGFVSSAIICILSHEKWEDGKLYDLNIVSFSRRF